MITRTADENFTGSLLGGKGFYKTDDQTIGSPFNYYSRFSKEAGTSPEDLLAAAHAGCFSMSLNDLVTKAGFEPNFINAKAKLKLQKSFDGSFRISSIRIECEANINGIQESHFRELAKYAIKGCPISQALAGVEISLTARLKTGDFEYYY